MYPSLFIVADDEVLMIQVLQSMPFGSSERDYMSPDSDIVYEFLGGDEALIAKPSSMANLLSTTSAVCFWFKIRQTLTSSTAILTIAANDDAGIFGFVYLAVSGKPFQLL